MLKIHQLFVFKFLILVFSTILITSVVSYLFLEKSLLKSNKTRIENVMDIIELNLDSQRSIETYLQRVGQKTELQITLSKFSRDTDKLLYIEKKFFHNSKEIYIGVEANTEQIMDEIHSLWMVLGAVISFILLISLYIAKSMAYRVEHDINAIREYLKAISGKDYEAHIHIKYYKEFLEISLLMKNLVKRLNNREKKVVKKSGKK